MKLQTKIVLSVSLGLFIFFWFGITDRGQEVLRGRIPENASHVEADDRYMGAGLAPWVLGLIPSIFTGIWGLGLLWADRRAKNHDSN
jgi:hypothetical protein